MPNKSVELNENKLRLHARWPKGKGRVATAVLPQRPGFSHGPMQYAANPLRNFKLTSNKEGADSRKINENAA